ncbi:uncharacterized protein LOC135499440, partial [Lineus longissimus]|uniref:uncharacterized protein LOC135499440 n=1 Tax=Lineus longissimus TaxID=88925 RepID=UPI00315C8DBA
SIETPLTSSIEMASSIETPLTSSIEISSSTETPSTSSIEISSLTETPFTSSIEISSSIETPLTSSIEIASSIEASSTSSIEISSSIEATLTSSIEIASSIEAPSTSSIEISSSIETPSTSLIEISSSIETPLTSSIEISSSIEAPFTSSIEIASSIEAPSTSSIEISSSTIETPLTSLIEISSFIETPVVTRSLTADKTTPTTTLPSHESAQRDAKTTFKPSPRETIHLFPTGTKVIMLSSGLVIPTASSSSTGTVATTSSSVNTTDTETTTTIIETTTELHVNTTTTPINTIEIPTNTTDIPTNTTNTTNKTVAPGPSTSTTETPATEETTSTIHESTTHEDTTTASQATTTIAETSTSMSSTSEPTLPYERKPDYTGKKSNVKYSIKILRNFYNSMPKNETFVRITKEEINAFFEILQYFDSITVRNITAGSVNVDFTISMDLLTVIKLQEADPLFGANRDLNDRVLLPYFTNESTKIEGYPLDLGFSRHASAALLADIFDVCNLEYICPPGYTCLSYKTAIPGRISAVCRDKCVAFRCGGGMCFIDGNGDPRCRCNQDDQFYYTGSHCEIQNPLLSRDDETLIIILCVLGVLMAIAFLICVCFCYQRSREGKLKIITQETPSIGIEGIYSRMEGRYVPPSVKLLDVTQPSYWREQETRRRSQV